MIDTITNHRFALEFLDQVPPRCCPNPFVEFFRSDWCVVLVEWIHGQLDVKLVNLTKEIPNTVIAFPSMQ